MVNSVVKYNTFKYYLDPWNTDGCVFEYNIGASNNNDKRNTYVNNIEKSMYSGNLDTVYMTKDAEISTEHGAFAGDDPYVISGIAPGPYIEDITVPVSVAQGNEMKVTVKIGTSR